MYILLFPCDDTHSAPTLHQLLQPSLFMAGDQLVVPTEASHFFFTLQEIQSREREKKEQTNNMFGLTQVQKESYGTLCMCRLTLVWILAKLLQSYWNADSSSLTALDLISSDWSLCSGVDWSLASPFTNCQLLSPFVSLSHWRSLPTSGHAEISSPKPFVWFRAKTDKGIVCLADHLHSVTSLENYRYLGICQSTRLPGPLCFCLSCVLTQQVICTSPNCMHGLIPNISLSFLHI